jgi:hypothetical protein
MISSAHQVPGSPHLAWIDIGHGEQATPEQTCNFAGVDFVIFAFTAVDGPHIKSMPQDKGDLLINTEISQPVPGEHASRADDNVIPVWFYGPEKEIRFGFDVSVQDDLSFLIKDAEIHFVGVQVDATIIVVLFAVKSHEKASFVEVYTYPASSIAESVCPGARGPSLLSIHSTRPTRTRDFSRLFKHFATLLATMRNCGKSGHLKMQDKITAFSTINLPISYFQLPMS